MKKFLLFLSLLALYSPVQAQSDTEGKAGEMVVYRSSSCTCCGRWLEHVKANGFKVKDIVTDEVQSIKDKYGVSAQMASCHTALIDGYVVEGHVPAQDIKKLLATKPAVTGIAVPGMVTGSPGMEMGDAKTPYEVISFDKNQNYQVFNSYK